MKNKCTCLALLVWAATSVCARSQDFRTDTNPALLYYQAFLVAPEAMSDTDRDYLASRKAREQKLPERFGKIVAGSDRQSYFVRQAARTKVPCDWGMDFSAGPDTALPHLGRAKATAQALQLRAIWALQHGRQADARDELLAAFVLGRNAGAGDLFISASVQCMIETIDYGTVAQCFGDFTAETLKQLVDGFDAAPPRHTMAACVPSEKELYGWISKELSALQKAHPNDDAKVMAAFRNGGMVTVIESIGHTNFWERLVAASGGTSQGVLKLLKEIEPFYARVGEIMALPEPEYERQVKQFLAETQNSRNPFFSLLDALFQGLVLGQQKFPLRVREFRAQAQLAMVHAALEYKLHGEAGLKTVLDPFGNGPFAFRRFVFKGLDRGFELKSAYSADEAPFVMIFVEKPGPAFQVIGPDAGKPITK